ncbi:MAG: M14 family metallopeptidase [Acidobacteriota bacterium]
MNKKLLVSVCISLLLIPFLLSAQTHPKDFLGFEVGADRKLADYDQITEYFKKLDEESNKIKVLTIGESTLGKPIIMAVITAEENMDQLDNYTQITKQLREVRGLTPEKAKKLSQEGKAILLITCNIHATEIASSQMAMELAYDLVTGNTSFDSDAALKDVIVLLAPTINPDGEQMVTEWYRKYVGTKYEGSSMPWLYHHYAGHDNNRDWFMFNLKETQAVTKVLYHDWIPQIHIDEHQMGSTGARLFIPPFMDPPVPTIHPLLWRGVALCGMNMAYDLQKNGFKGVVHGRSFSGWWIGACDDTSWLHNCIGLLSEMASVKVATPIYIEPNEIPDSYVEKRLQFPDPWMGGWWRLRDLVEYELTLSKSLVKTAHVYKQDLLYNFYKMNKDAIETREPGQPFAFVISKDQRDFPTTLRMLEILKFGGVEIHQAEKDFVADSKLYPSGSFVVLMSQPYRPYAQSLLEKQEYPDIRQYPGGPPVPPYDNAGWTLPLQMGVECEQIDSPFKTELVELEEIPDPEIPAPSEEAPYIVLDSKQNASYSVIFSLLKNNPTVFRSDQPVNGDDFHTCYGSFIVENTPQVQKDLPSLLEKWNVNAYSISDISEIKKSPLKNPKIALYQSWKSNMDEGWTRYMLDDLKVPYTTIHNKDFTEKKDQPADLKEKFDVIIFASESPDIIKTGKPDPKSRYARYYTEGPPEYEGGIGKKGVEVLKNFVSEGGILVTLNDACELAINEFKPPVSNTLEGVSREKFFCPTSILKLEVNRRSPIGYGMSSETAAIFARSKAFSTSIPDMEWDRTVVASYPKKDMLLSGWLLGEDTLSRRAAVVDVQYKKGHLILIGIRCQHRAQSHGTYKFLLNAVLYPETD